MSAISQTVMTKDEGINLERLKEPFREDEVEFRLAQCGEGRDNKIWAKALAYITSRAIMDRLDSVCGAGNWKVSYEFVGATGVVCNLSIFLNGSWVTKQDGAEMTEIESFKGGISSALKRAGSAWGMGRYLYSLESDFLPENHILDKQRDGAYYSKTKTGKTFYWLPPLLPAWALPKSEKPSAQVTTGPKLIESSSPARDELNRKVMALYKPYLTKFPGVVISDLLKTRYGFKEVKDITIEQFMDFVSYLETALQSSPAPAQISQVKPVNAKIKTVERKPSEAQLKRLFAISKQFGVSDAEVKTYILGRYKKSSREDLSLSEYNELCDGITAKTISFSQD